MEESKYTIKQVADNKEKGNSYKENMKRYNRAKAGEFYLECLWILYAMIEDRSSAFLYYLGFTGENKRYAVTGQKRIKTEIRDIFKMEETESNYKFSKLYDKLGRIRQVLEWSVSNPECDSQYKLALNKALIPLAENSDFIDALNYLEEEWRDKRNQLTHALFNKNPESVLGELLELVEEGYHAVRQMDRAVRVVKKAHLRARFNIQ